MPAATEQCVRSGHVRSGGENSQCYTCMCLERDPEVPLLAKVLMNEERIVMQKALQYAIEKLANAFSELCNDPPENSYEGNPVSTMKKARWYLDNAIMQEEQR